MFYTLLHPDIIIDSLSKIKKHTLLIIYPFSSYKYINI